MRRILFLVFATCAPAIATAQSPSSGSQSIDDVRRNSRGHVGPFYMTPGIQLKELGVDTNVFNQTAEPKSDFTFTVAPKLDVAVPVARRALFTAALATDLVWYAKYSTERSLDPQATVRGEAYLHRLTLFAQDAYLNTRQRPSYEIDVRSRHLENNFEGGAEYRLTPRFSMGVSGRRAITEFDADAFFLGTSLREALNRESIGFTVTAKHRLTPLTTLSVKVDDFGDRFPFSPQRDTDTLRVMPGVEFKPRALIVGSASVGFRRFTPRDPTALREFSGAVATLGLSHTLLGSTTFGVSYVRDVNYSFEQAYPYYIANSAGLSIRRALASRVDVLGSIDRHLYSYRDLLIPLVASSIPNTRVDTTWNYAGSIGYRPKRTTRIGLGVSYWQRDSTVASLRNYDDLRIGITLTYGS